MLSLSDLHGFEKTAALSLVAETFRSQIIGRNAGG
jgi:hypothetical protein